MHLVNHGPAEDTVLRAALPFQLRSQVTFIGNATAGSIVGTVDLPQTIRAVLFPARAAAVATSKAPRPTRTDALPAGLEAQVFLTWDVSLQDMDLTLHLLDANGMTTETVDFRHRGDMNMQPFALLVDDVQRGPGTERIDVVRWSVARYALVATNYSGQGSMNPTNLACRIVTARDALTLTCPIQMPPTQMEWRIAEIEVKHRQLLVTPLLGHQKVSTAMAR